METKELILKIEKCFPLVDKPKDRDLFVHKSDCFECESMQKDLAQVEGTSLPDNIIRWIHQDLSCFTSKGWLWIMPSYLKYCLTKEPSYDSIETEFLIYNLGQNQKHKEEAKCRLGLFKPEQIQCLIAFLEWCLNHDHWSEYCPDECLKAIEFLSVDCA